MLIPAIASTYKQACCSQSSLHNLATPSSLPIQRSAAVNRMAKLAALSLALAVCLLAQCSEACIYKFGTSKDSLVSRGSRLRAIGGEPRVQRSCRPTAHAACVLKAHSYSILGKPKSWLSSMGRTLESVRSHSHDMYATQVTCLFRWRKETLPQCGPMMLPCYLAALLALLAAAVGLLVPLLGKRISRTSLRIASGTLT